MGAGLIASRKWLVDRCVAKSVPRARNEEHETGVAMPYEASINYTYGRACGWPALTFFLPPALIILALVILLPPCSSSPSFLLLLLFFQALDHSCPSGPLHASPLFSNVSPLFVAL